MGSIELEIVLGMGTKRIKKKKKKKKGNRKKGNRKKQKQKTTPVKGRTGMFYSTDWIFQNTNSSRQTMIEHDYTYHRILPSLTVWVLCASRRWFKFFLLTQWYHEDSYSQSQSFRAPPSLLPHTLCVTQRPPH